MSWTFVISIFLLLFVIIICITGERKITGSRRLSNYMSRPVDIEQLIAMDIPPNGRTIRAPNVGPSIIAQLHRRNINNANRSCFVLDIPEWAAVEGTDEEGVPDDPEHTCKICMVNKIKTVLIPCYHAATCISCTNRLSQDRKCPMCRETIQLAKRFYL